MRKKPTIHIAAYSDLDHREDRQRLWGDYWIKLRLSAEFNRRGFDTLEEIGPRDRPDILLHLFGSPMPGLPRAAGARILWLHSHPDTVTPELLAGCQLVYCVSRPFTDRLRRDGTDARWLMLPTHMRPLPLDKKNPLVFVGNNRRDGVRRIMNDLMESRDNLPCPVAVWGDGWEGKIPGEWLRDREYPNEKLNELYATSRIVLNDHHPDMAREGFLNPRILDACMAGAMVVTDPVAGLEEIVDIPVYRDAGDLASIITQFLDDEPKRVEAVARAQEKLSGETYENAVGKILADIGLT